VKITPIAPVAVNASMVPVKAAELVVATLRVARLREPVFRINASAAAVLAAVASITLNALLPSNA
jgi:hypothetical protein